MRFATVVASCARAAKVNAVTLKLGMESLTRVCVLTEVETKHRQHGQFRSMRTRWRRRVGRKRAVRQVNVLKRVWVGAIKRFSRVTVSLRRTAMGTG
jgi:hypothetical protein